MAFYPDRLLTDEVIRNSMQERKSSQYCASISTAYTVSLKAAMLVHYLYSFFERDGEGDENRAMLSHALTLIAYHCGYANIAMPKEFWPLYSISECSEEEYCKDFTLPDFLGRSMSQKRMINYDGLVEFIAKVVLNPNVVIVDKSEEY